MIDHTGLNILSISLYNARKKCDKSFDDKFEDFSLTKLEEQIINLIEKELKLDYLGHGASRVVFEIPNQDKIVKIARYGNLNKIHDGLHQNNR